MPALCHTLEGIFKKYQLSLESFLMRQRFHLRFDEALELIERYDAIHEACYIAVFRQDPHSFKVIRIYPHPDQIILILVLSLFLLPVV